MTTSTSTAAKARVLAVASLIAFLASIIVFTPAASALDVITTPETGSAGGRDPSLALDAAGNPVIAYTGNGLMVLHCDDPNCEGTETPTSPDPSRRSGVDPSLLLDATGNPVIAYHDAANNTLKLLHCDDPNCEGTETATIHDTAGPVAVNPSLALDGAGNPVIAYYDVANEALKLLHCDDPNCEGTETAITVGDSGRLVSLAVDAAGNPVMAFPASDGSGLAVLHCDDPRCEGTETPIVVTGTVPSSVHPSLVLDGAGNPVVSYHGDADGDLHLLHCDDPNCAGIETATSPDTQGRVGGYSSLALDAAGNPVIAYEDQTNDDLKVLHCDDPNCEGTEIPTSPDTQGQLGLSQSLALDAAGNPVVAYFHLSAIDELRVLHCNGPQCTTSYCDGKLVTIDLRFGASGAGTAGDDVILGTSGDDVIDAMAGNDTVCAEAGNDTIVGGAGDDWLFGGTGDDRIRGNQGADMIDGHDGNDFLFGGIDDDTISGGRGSDFIGGFGGADTLRGGWGPDIMFGGFGADHMQGGSGNDLMYGLVGNDIIRGGQDDDIITGDRGQDTIFGDRGNDELFGGNGPDMIDGGADNDQLNGGKADDILDGDGQYDICTGNAGTDIAIDCESTFGIP